MLSSTKTSFGSVELFVAAATASSFWATATLVVCSKVTERTTNKLAACVPSMLQRNSSISALWKLRVMMYVGLFQCWYLVGLVNNA